VTLDKAERKVKFAIPWREVVDDWWVRVRVILRYFVRLWLGDAENNGRNSWLDSLVNGGFRVVVVAGLLCVFDFVVCFVVVGSWRKHPSNEVQAPKPRDEEPTISLSHSTISQLPHTLTGYFLTIL
jgi:hypothetical protein